MKKYLTRNLFSAFTALFLFISVHNAEATSENAVCITNDSFVRDAFSDDVSGGNNSINKIIRWQLKDNQFTTTLASGKFSSVYRVTTRAGRVVSFYGVYKNDQSNKITSYIIEEVENVGKGSDLTKPLRYWSIRYITKPLDPRRVIEGLVQDSKTGIWYIKYDTKATHFTSDISIPTEDQIKSNAGEYILSCRIDLGAGGFLIYPGNEKENVVEENLSKLILKSDLFKSTGKSYNATNTPGGITPAIPISSSGSSSSSSGGGHDSSSSSSSSSSSGGDSSSSSSSSSSSGGGGGSSSSSSSGGSSSSSSMKPGSLVDLRICAFKNTEDKTRYAFWLQKRADGVLSNPKDFSNFIAASSAQEVIRDQSSLNPYTVTLKDHTYDQIFTFTEIQEGSKMQTAHLPGILEFPHQIMDLKKMKDARRSYLVVEVSNNRGEASSKSPALCKTIPVAIDKAEEIAEIKMIESILHPTSVAKGTDANPELIARLSTSDLYFCAFKKADGTSWIKNKVRYLSWTKPVDKSLPFAIHPFNTITASLKQVLPTITLDDKRSPGQFTTLTLTKQNINDYEEINKVAASFKMPQLPGLEDAEASKEIWFVSGKYKGELDIKNRPAICYKLLASQHSASAQLFADTVVKSVKNSWPTEPIVMQISSEGNNGKYIDGATCISKEKGGPTIVKWKLNLNAPQDPLSVNILRNHELINLPSDIKHIVVNFTDTGGYISKIFSSRGNKWILGKDNNNPTDNAWTLSTLATKNKWNNEALTCLPEAAKIPWKSRRMRAMASETLNAYHIHFNYCVDPTEDNLGICAPENQDSPELGDVADRRQSAPDSDKTYEHKNEKGDKGYEHKDEQDE
ncbi:MAG: hypothetical protein K0R14_1283 [Burkholderiales bacterium]|jgi:hypothetical protein|nr:hypothetical protein [Burkholderiales bacterium]